jgi:hypothetical protein
MCGPSPGKATRGLVRSNWKVNDSGSWKESARPVRGSDGSLAAATASKLIPAVVR